MIPVFGEIADLANAAWYAADGEGLEAAICLAAAVPIAGIGVIGAKIANNGFKAWRKSKQVANAIDTAEDLGGGLVDDVLEEGVEQASKRATNFALSNLDSFRGAKSDDVIKWLEQNGWSGVKTNPNRMYNDGMRFTNGVKGEQIRIMTGGPTRSIPAKTGPYMEVSMNGQKTVIELFGNPTLK